MDKEFFLRKRYLKFENYSLCYMMFYFITRKIIYWKYHTQFKKYYIYSNECIVRYFILYIFIKYLGPKEITRVLYAVIHIIIMYFKYAILLFIIIYSKSLHLFRYLICKYIKQSGQ